ncbi:hypothetical protein [Paraburkholderia dilworthii]|uniref:Helix-turn-helix n=1 Tax=Paraburkholderia dilworthii TaxID=948106 RepID=A0ABW9DC25_9BURK
MNRQHPTFLDATLACLDKEKGNLRAIAQLTGVPYSTLAKISARTVTDPRVSTVQALHDYFAGRSEQPPSADRGRPTH